MMLNALEVLILINVILIGSLFFLTFWQAEQEAVLFIENPAEASQLAHQDQATLQVGTSWEPEEGVRIWPIIQERTPLKEYQVLRHVAFEKNSTSFLNKMESMEYRLFFIRENRSLSFDVGKSIFEYAILFKILLALEGLILIMVSIKAKKKIRRILRPVAEMGQKANPSTGAKAGVSPEEMKRLRELAGTISSIDATKLDKRLKVDDTQKELKELANAINSMLNRIDEAYKSQVRFVSDASHELRTPIAVIQGYANLLDRWGKNDAATTQEAIDAIKSESDNMKDLVEQLLFLARGDNETLELYLEEIDCGQLVDEILQETQMIDGNHTFRKKETILSENWENGDLIMADRQLIKQALRILVDNSIKYTPAGGEIIVSVTTQDELVKISVQDNGIGMDPDNLPYIFDRFYRSDDSRARKTGGSGLGLSIMKWIVERHEGKIEVISRKEIGTRTTIVLPRWVKK